MSETCAYCLAGRCGHPACKTPGFGMQACTVVGGTSSCEDCAPVLLELVLNPLRVLDPDGTVRLVAPGETVVGQTVTGRETPRWTY